MESLIHYLQTFGGLALIIAIIALCVFLVMVIALGVLSPIFIYKTSKNIEDINRKIDILETIATDTRLIRRQTDIRNMK
jgi:cell division protein FtsL